MNLAVNNTSLFLAAMLVLVALGISLWQKLGLDRDIVIGVVRAVVQLFIVGYLLKYIFRVNNLWLTLAMMGFIRTAQLRWKRYRMRSRRVRLLFQAL